jgi:hypothetical protein
MSTLNTLRQKIISILRAGSIGVANADILNAPILHIDADYDTLPLVAVYTPESEAGDLEVPLNPGSVEYHTVTTVAIDVVSATLAQTENIVDAAKTALYSNVTLDGLIDKPLSISESYTLQRDGGEDKVTGEVVLRVQYYESF